MGPNKSNSDHIITQHMSFEPKMMDINRKFLEQGEGIRRHVPNLEYEDCSNMEEKYSFPYTGKVKTIFELFSQFSAFY